jgi:hypothetical protein
MQTQRFVPWCAPAPRRMHSFTVAKANPVALVRHVVWTDFSSSWQVLRFAVPAAKIVSEHDNAADALKVLDSIEASFWEGVASTSTHAVNRAAALQHLARIHAPGHDNSIREGR